MKKWKKYIPQGFESFGYSNDTSANIYLSMLVSPAWLALTKNAQILYVYCKSQYYAERRKPIPQIRQLNDTQLKRCFTMNKSKWLDVYHIYNSEYGQFYKDMAMLVEQGFIEVVESGKSNRTKSIYMFSDKWREKGEPVAIFNKCVRKTPQD